MFDPNDYAGETNEGSARERHDLIAREAEEREERELVACLEADYYSALYPAQIEAPTLAAMIAARSVAEHANPVHAALNGWVLAVTPKPTPRYAAIGNGIFVRVGTGRKNRRAA
jgi:hypothetical protein